jgi:hypothetical protein
MAVAAVVASVDKVGVATMVVEVPGSPMPTGPVPVMVDTVAAMETVGVNVAVGKRVPWASAVSWASC